MTETDRTFIRLQPRYFLLILNNAVADKFVKNGKERIGTNREIIFFKNNNRGENKFFMDTRYTFPFNQ